MTIRGFCLLLLICSAMISVPTGAAYGGVSFESVYDNLDLRKNTRLYVREYWKGVEGKEVVWSGTVFDVRGGRGRAELRIWNKARAAARGFNISVVVYDVQKAALLKKGQRVRLRGLLHDFDSGRRGGVRITLREGEIL